MKFVAIDEDGRFLAMVFARTKAQADAYFLANLHPVFHPFTVKDVTQDA